jgi:hypothetical protein
MISGIDLAATVDYTLKGDSDNPTIWKLGVLPSNILGQLSSQVSETEQVKMAFRLLQLSIRGWQNFSNVEYKTEKEIIAGQEVQVVPLDLISRIPLKAVTELSSKVLEINGLTTEERKN